MAGSAGYFDEMYAEDDMMGTQGVSLQEAQAQIRAISEAAANTASDDAAPAPAQQLAAEEEFVYNAKVGAWMPRGADPQQCRSSGPQRI